MLCLVSVGDEGSMLRSLCMPQTKRQSHGYHRLAHNITGAPLVESLRVVADATLTVSVNTGVVHMAAALDVPLVALYGPSKAESWRPIGERTIVVQSSLAFAGYLNLGLETPRNPPPCIKAIC